jgi:hypothetical protein
MYARIAVKQTVQGEENLKPEADTEMASQAQVVFIQITHSLYDNNLTRQRQIKQPGFKESENMNRWHVMAVSMQIFACGRMYTPVKTAWRVLLTNWRSVF